MSKALALCTSGNITAVTPTCIRIPNWEHGVDEADHIVLDFSQYWLPESSIYPAKRLSDSHILATATVLAIDEYLSGIGPSKSAHMTATQILHALARVWEWGYLHEIYRPESWTAAHFRELWRELRVGGWPLALQLEKRTQSGLHSSRDIDFLIAPSHEKEGVPSICGSAVQDWLRTNMHGRSLAKARVLILRSKQIPAENSEYPRYSRTSLRTILGAMQRVARVDAPYGFKIDPETVLGSSARSDGVPSKRTPNLDIATAVTLLDSSLKWVYSYSGPIIALVQESLRIAQESHGLNDHARRKKYRSLLADHPLKKTVEEMLGIEVTLMQGRKSGVTMLHHVVGMLMTAAFVVLAVMNARRRDEIRHPKLGLKRGAIREIDKGLGLYEAMFYIEKSLKSYAPFYVNKATFDAFQVLIRLNELHVDAEKAVGLTSADSTAASIFWQRPFRMVDGLSKVRIWFNFDQGSNGVAMKFVKHALGQKTSMRVIHSHMFRRFYALIFFYRFEHATLQAVAYQLGHLNLGVTRQYVSDASIISDRERIPIELLKSPEVVRQAIDADGAGLARVLEGVGREKLEKMIEFLLQGEPFSGGFQRLVQRLHNKLALRVDYSEMDKVMQARRIAAVLSQKGHGVTPFPHGECMAGSVGKRRSARCYSEALNGLDRSTASASTCAQCSYHVVSLGYLRAQKNDLERLQAEIEQWEPKTMQARHLSSMAQNLATAIQLHSVRLGVQK